MYGFLCKNWQFRKISKNEHNFEHNLEKKKDLALSVIACMQTTPIEEIGDVCTRGNASDNDNQSAVGPDKFVNGLFSCGNMEAESL